MGRVRGCRTYPSELLPLVLRCPIAVLKYSPSLIVESYDLTL